MGITAVSVFFIFAFFHHVHPFLLTPEEYASYRKNCPKFKCGKLGDIDFPYTNHTRPDCGLFMVDGCDKESQSIQFVKGEGKFYQVESISMANVISVVDKEFHKQLDSNSCEAFNNLSLPTLPHASFQIMSNLTLLKCKRPVDVASHLANFEFKYTDCENFSIYYTYQNKSVLNERPHCSAVQLPVNATEGYVDIFKLLTAKFSLNFTFDFCDGCVLGGKCVYNRGFRYCDGSKSRPEPPLSPEPPPKSTGSEESRLKLGLGLGLGLGGTAAIMTILVIIWHQYKKKFVLSNFHLANTSTDDSKSYLEGGNVCMKVPIFSYDELEEATNNFDSEGELGDGGFGTVYYGKLQDGREVAVKRLYEHNYKRVKQFMNEIEILAGLRHKNLVSLYGCTSRNSRELLLVYEYIPNGTVADHLHGDRAKSSVMNWPIRMRIAIETATALSYLHSSDIIHRDVKTRNILLDKNFCVKVADFGLSRLFPNDVTHVSTAPQGTPGYVDPEYYQCYQLTVKSDVYSFGVVLVELISSMPAVDISRNRDEINLARFAINKIQKSAFEELIDPSLGYNSDGEIERMTTSVAELAFRCLQQDKEMRPSMVEVLEELISIESKEYKLDILEAPVAALECDEVTLLNNIQSSLSPDSVASMGFSSVSTTPNVSSSS